MPDKQFTDERHRVTSGPSRPGNGRSEGAADVTNLLNLTPADALIALGSFMAELGSMARASSCSASRTARRSRPSRSPKESA
jgi:hypothetical protein